MPSAIRARSLFVGVVVLGAVAAGCGSGDGGDRSAATPAGSVTTTLPADSTATPATTAAPGPATTAPPTTVRRRLPVAGFGEIAYRVQGTPAQRCALLAETDSQHGRGLMNRTDLAGYDGMLFVFDSNTTGGFWMKDTLIPLSIAWFRSDGSLVSTADMAPCVTVTCPNYDPAGAYRFALEVPQGGLGALGIGPGSVISVGGACA